MTKQDTVRQTIVSMTLLATLFLWAACGGRPQEEQTASLAPIPSHTLKTSGQVAAPGQASMPEETAGTGDLTWTVPKEWRDEPPKSAMRKAQYRLAAAPGDKEDAECVVYYFGAGQGGDVKSNLDRWAGQFTGRGATPPKFSEMKAGGLTVDRAEVRGTYTPSPMAMGGGPEPQPRPDFMLLGAIVPGPDANWFFKCTGPAKTMESNRARFDTLLASVRKAR